jgi:hypothetical protein
VDGDLLVGDVVVAVVEAHHLHQVVLVAASEDDHVALHRQGFDDLFVEGEHLVLYHHAGQLAELGFRLFLVQYADFVGDAIGHYCFVNSIKVRPFNSQETRTVYVLLSVTMPLPNLEFPLK